MKIDLDNKFIFKFLMRVFHAIIGRNAILRAGQAKIGTPANGLENTTDLFTPRRGSRRVDGFLIIDKLPVAPLEKGVVRIFDTVNKDLFV